MKISFKYNFLLSTVVAIYFFHSKQIFDKVYETSTIVIDELFHIPQGLAYCNGKFSHWDPKITTLPGLYLVSAATVGTYFPCTTYNLRLVNLIGSSLNLILFCSLLKFIFGTNMESDVKIVLQGLSLALLPPLYFFSHIYYTDTLSLLFLLLYSRLCIVNSRSVFILITGMFSLFMRQTNVVWVALVFGHKLLLLAIRSSRVYGNSYLTKLTFNKRSDFARDIDKSKLKRYYGINDLIIAAKYHLSTFFTTFTQYVSGTNWFIMTQQVTIMLAFIIFVYLNGSIVVGDKQAHKVTVNVPQLLYFLLFYGVFALPYVLAKTLTTLKMIYNNKINALLITVTIALIVYLNTVVHPYLLADNRHYTFYIWNRWFGKYDYAVYATVPLYVFLLFNLYDNLKGQNCISFLFPYSVCLFFVLALQSLVEIRYFLTPYVILRLRFIRASYKIVLAELFWYVFLNVITFHIFFSKEIFWKDFKDAQRIIW